MTVSISPAVPDDSSGKKSAAEKADQRDRLGKNLLSIGDAVIVTDSLGNVILLNAAAEFLTGWTDHDARDRPIETVFRIIHEVTREPVLQPVHEVIERGGVQTLAQWTLLVAKNGSERAIADSASAIHDETGHLDGVVLIFKDTTVSRAEERRHDEDRRHGEVIIATVRDPLVVLNSDLKIRSANLSFYETFQTTPGETLNQSFLDLGNGQWKSQGLQSLLEEILNGNTSSGEFQVERDFPSIGKKVMLINARKLNGKDGHNVMILIAIEDITERSQMANSLAASEVRFRRLFESAKDGILILNAETGAIDDANPFLLDLLGYTRLEVLGKHLWEIGLFGDIEASRMSFRELQEKGYVRYENLPLETKDGQHVDVEVVSNVYHVNERMIIQCNIRDVTARKRVEDENKRAKEALEASGRAKDRFLATLSHELRTPLTPVLATLAYLEMTQHLPAAELQQELDSIRRNVELEAQLIDDLLDVTRIGSGKVELHREVLDIHAALRSALAVCQPEIDAKTLEVSLALRAKEHRVWADPARIQQVFWNLIKNAVKFTPDSGRISVRSADVGPERMAIEVADTGIGIAPESLARIFDAFEQGDQSVTRQHGGLGLGLTIARTLVDLHGGRLTATSQGRSCGSVFRVELETVAELMNQDPPVELAMSGVHKVLLVDDNAETLRTIAMVLRSSGFDVRTAESVESAFAALRLEHFNLLVSDIGLPDGSGLDIMRHCRDNLGLKGIAFSGYATDYDLRSSQEAGFAHHLAKPAGLGRMIGLAKRMVS
jgi:PAS domain S-box-containing protein